MNELTGPHKIGTATTRIPDPDSSARRATTPGALLTLQSGKELCLSCHKAPLSDKWHSATHNEANLLCIDCHKPHPSVNAASPREAQAREHRGPASTHVRAPSSDLRSVPRADPI